MPLHDRQIRSLLIGSSETHGEELDCDQFLAVMPRIAEARASGRPLPETLAMAEAHERLCANCAEECRALIELVLPLGREGGR